MKRALFFILFLSFISQFAQAQITAPDAEATIATQYPEFNETDDIYLFCNSDSISSTGSLTVTTSLTGTKTFLWEKYNEASASFELYSQESIEASSSEISGLADGCYRATVTQGSTTEIDRAWVFNNWIYADGYISKSTCEYFTLKSNFKNASSFTYYDLSSNKSVTFNNSPNIEWLNDGNNFSSLATIQVYDPPTTNTYYTLRVYDDYGCETTVSVLYESVVTEASFTADPTSGEAPLAVTFNNTSVNGTTGQYQWFFYYSLGELEEASNNSSEIDSIDFIAYDDSPTYTYENTGEYMVKLVSTHISDTLTCTDTVYMSDYIEVDSSYIIAPNVFTPNGDGSNDEFVIKFWSMKSLKIDIFNRWGKRVHHWNSGNIQGFEDTMEQSVWDGKIGGKYASPGVYYYVVEGHGRDGQKRKEHGFVHLFRGKD